MDRFEAMSMLLTAVDGGRLSAAAREMRVPISTLSRKVAELEAFLGTKLLIRTTRNLTLTDAGISYVAAVRRILEEVEEAERDAAGEFQTPRGTLVITVLTMAHAILRQGGVDVGKMAFPGPINLVEI